MLWGQEKLITSWTCQSCQDDPLKMLGDIINQETFILHHAALHLALHVPLHATLHLQSCVLHESNVWTILQHAVLHTSQWCAAVIVHINSINSCCCCWVLAGWKWLFGNSWQMSAPGSITAPVIQYNTNITSPPTPAPHQHQHWEQIIIMSYW